MAPEIRLSRHPFIETIVVPLDYMSAYGSKMHTAYLWKIICSCKCKTLQLLKYVPKNEVLELPAILELLSPLIDIIWHNIIIAGDLTYLQQSTNQLSSASSPAAGMQQCHWGEWVH